MAKRTFYSNSSGLTISPPGMKGEFKEIDGETKRVGETIIQFVPMGNHRLAGGKEFGYFVTENEREIAYLEKRAAEVGDVFDEKEYNRVSTPPEIRAEQATRKLEDQNRLIEQLQAQIASRGQVDKPVHAPTK
jgi:hypothetical protein